VKICPLFNSDFLKIINQMNIIFKVFFITLILFIHKANSQELVRGNIIDKTSQKPIPDVSIHLKGKDIGTISNSNGDFTIKVDHDSIVFVFNHIGFAEKEAEYSPSNSKFYTIVLEPQPIVLNEVLVTNINLKSTIEKAFSAGLDRLKYKVDSDFFYRQKTTTENQPSEFIEAFYKGKISVKGIDEIKFYQGRFAKIPASNKNATPSIVNFYYFSSIPIIQEKINDVIFPMNSKFCDYYEYSLANIIGDEINGNIAVISFTPKILSKAIFEGKVYINLQDFSVVKIEGDIKNQMGLDFADPSYTAINANYSFNASFNNVMQGLPLFSSIKVSLDFDLQNEGQIKPVHVESSMVAYNYSDKTIKKGDGKVKSNRNLISDIQNKKYDPAFWQNNSIIKRTSEEENTIKAFEQNSLFSTNGNNP
jgi:hypothetical protein